MICELCGKFCNEGFRISLEGSTVSACPECAKLGEVKTSIRPPPKQKPAVKAAAAAKQEPLPIERGKGTEYELIDDFGVKVKAAREKRGWTQEELGKMVNEPQSLIHRIELGKFEPPETLSHALQSKLGIRLLVPHEEEDEPSTKPGSKEITLGDLVVIRKRSE